MKKLLVVLLAVGCGGSESDCDIGGRDLVINCPATPACGRCTGASSPTAITLSPAASESGAWTDGRNYTYRLAPSTCTLTAEENPRLTARITGTTGVYFNYSVCGTEECSSFSCTVVVR